METKEDKNSIYKKIEILIYQLFILISLYNCDDKKYDKKYDLLFEACENGDFLIVKDLIDKDYDVNYITTVWKQPPEFKGLIKLRNPNSVNQTCIPL